MIKASFSGYFTLVAGISLQLKIFVIRASFGSILKENILRKSHQNVSEK